MTLHDRGRPLIARWLHWLATRLENKSREYCVRDLPARARGGFDCLESVEILLRHHVPLEVLDVGAWRGRWSLALLHRAPTVTRVTMVEPQPQAAAELALVALPCDKVIIQKALAASAGLTSFHAGTASASLLEPGKLGEHFPLSVPTQKCEVNCETLDALVESGEIAQPDTIKLDVQGGELAALRGATKTLRKVHALVIETSWSSLYLGEPSAADLIGFLYEQGFRVVDCSGGLRDDSGVILHKDLLFIRSR